MESIIWSLTTCLLCHFLSKLCKLIHNSLFYFCSLLSLKYPAITNTEIPSINEIKSTLIFFIFTQYRIVEHASLGKLVSFQGKFTQRHLCSILFHLKALCLQQIYLTCHDKSDDCLFNAVCKNIHTYPNTHFFWVLMYRFRNIFGNHLFIIHYRNPYHKPTSVIFKNNPQKPTTTYHSAD